jgi:hypothetical protein
MEICKLSVKTNEKEKDIIRNVPKEDKMIELFVSNTTIGIMVGAVFVSLVSFIILYIVVSSRTHKQTIDMLVQNAAQLLNKIEELNKLKKQGGINMQDLIKVAKYLSRKIDTAKEEIMDRLDEIESNAVPAEEDDLNLDDDLDIGLDDVEPVKERVSKPKNDESEMLDNRKEEYKGKRRMKTSSSGKDEIELK